MGNLFSNKGKGNNSKTKQPGYEPFINGTQFGDYAETSVIHRLEDEIRALRNDLKQQTEKRERLEMRIAKMDSYIQSRHAELVNNQIITNTQMNEKINIMARDMENLLNNDKLLLDKLMEKNIVSTIGEAETEIEAESSYE